ncbi:MAG: glycosyltransferase [Chloroflexota bacterium]
MKILHLYKDYYPILGGIENYIKMLAEAQASEGHDVTVLVCDPGRKTKIEHLNGVRVIKAGRLFTAASMPISLTQPLYLLRQRPDIVHIQLPFPLGAFTNWLIGRGKATVLSYQSDIVRDSQQKWLRYYGPFLRRILKAADKIIVTTPHYITVSKWLTPVANKCTVVPIGVDTNRFSSRSDSVRTERNRDSASPFQLLFIGRLRYYKGLDTLIKAMPNIPDTHLTIGGTGPMKAEWEALTHELGLTNRIRFIGDVPDEILPQQYQKADLFVLPANARSEAYGIVMVEAMASGLPCITTELGTGTSWIVQDGVTGLVVAPNNVAELTDAVNTLRTSPDLREAFGKASQKRAKEHLSQEVMFTRINNIYQELATASQ